MASAGVWFAVFLVVVGQLSPSASALSAFDPLQPRTFFPPDAGPTLEHNSAPVGSVAVDFDFYHSFGGAAFRRFGGPSRALQALTNPIKIGVSHHDIADFHHPAIVWTFRDVGTGHLLASTVVLEDVFNLTGHDNVAVPRPVVPVFAPNPQAWLVGTSLPKIPATDVSSQATSLYNRWVLEYRNTVTGKRTVINEPITAASSPVPGDLAQGTRYELTMRYCNAQTQACSLTSPPVPFELRQSSAPTVSTDTIVGTGTISLGCPAWLVPFHQSLGEDHALLQLNLYQVNRNGQITPVLEHVNEPRAFPYTTSLPYGQYMGVWKYANPDLQSEVLFSTVVPYFHPPLHHRTTYPAVPYFANSIDSWVRGPSPTTIPKPVVTATVQNLYNQWQVRFENTQTGSITTATTGLTMTQSPLPSLSGGNYRVTMVFRSSSTNAESLRSPAFLVTVNSPTAPPTTQLPVTTTQQLVDDLHGE